MTGPEIKERSLLFSGWELRRRERQLIIDGEPARLGSRAFDVLLVLADRLGEVVSRNALLDGAWPGLCVEENNLSVQIATLRKLLGREAIATIPGLGYCLTAPLDKAAAPFDGPMQAPAQRAKGAGNLPPLIPELIGREDDLLRLQALVEDHRIVSAVGAGGIGKTRLAQAVAYHVRHGYADGVWMVELAPLNDSTLLAAGVAQAIGVRLPGKKSAQDELLEALIDSAVLLVLDNCEHLIDAVSNFVQALVNRTRAPRVLVTSQELLKLPGEQVFRLAPLSVPLAIDDGAVETYGAVKLLATRVRALVRVFEIDKSNAGDAAEICRRLDGMPLAIELAAARVPLLGLTGVRERLDERFHVLTGGSRTGLPRHRTLRETLDWSYGLLSTDEKTVFRRASVFAGSFGLPQAQRVLGGAEIDEWAVLEVLGGLVDKSLVVVDTMDPPRYRLLESAREYARELRGAAGETDEIQRRHAAAIHMLFHDSLEVDWTLPSQQRRKRYLPDLDNGRAALEWAAVADANLYIALTGKSAWLFSASGHGGEAIRYARRALEQVGEHTPPQLEARLQLEICRLESGEDADNLTAARRSVALFRQLGDARNLYRSLSRLAIAAALELEHPTSEAAVLEMEALHDRSWPALSQWELLVARDYRANSLGLFDEGEALAKKELELARAHGDTAKIVFAMLAAEQCVASLGRYEEAATRGAEVLTFAREEREIENIHVFEFNLAMSLAMCGRIDEALPLARRSAEIDARRDSLWKGLTLMALLALRRGRLELAARIVGRLDAKNERLEPVEKNLYKAVVAALTTSITPAKLSALKAEGAIMSVEDATALALAD